MKIKLLCSILSISLVFLFTGYKVEDKKLPHIFAESVSTEKTVESPNTALANVPLKSDIQQPDEPPQPSDPPLQLFFDSYDSILELYSVLEKSDKEIEEYLTSRNFDMNGLRTKSDIKELLTTLSELNFPLIEDFDSQSIIIYPDSNIMSIWYKLNNGIGYDFRLTTDPDSAQEKLDALKSSDQLLSRDNPGKLDDITVYSVPTERVKSDSKLQIYEMNAKGTYILVRIFDANNLRASAFDNLMGFEYDLLGDKNG